MKPFSIFLTLIIIISNTYAQNKPVGFYPMSESDFFGTIADLQGCSISPDGKNTDNNAERIKEELQSIPSRVFFERVRDPNQVGPEISKDVASGKALALKAFIALRDYDSSKAWDGDKHFGSHQMFNATDLDVYGVFAMPSEISTLPIVIKNPQHSQRDTFQTTEQFLNSPYTSDSLRALCLDPKAQDYVRRNFAVEKQLTGASITGPSEAIKTGLKPGEWIADHRTLLQGVIYTPPIRFYDLGRVNTI